MKWAVLPVLAVAAASCATGAGVTEVTGPAGEAAPGATTAGAVDTATSTPSTTPTTTTTSTTTTSTPSSTTTSPTTTSVPALAEAGPLVVDDEGVPVNGQTRGVVVHPDGWLLPVLGTAGDAWSVWTPCGRQAVVERGTYLSHVDVVVDPGHGGDREPGAVGPGGTRESDLNLAVARRLVDRLRVRGYEAVVTRPGDVRLPIVTRAEIALALRPAANISIHFNAGIDAPHAGPGTETYHQLDDPGSRRLAGLVQEGLTEALGGLDGVRWVGMSDAGAMARPDREGRDYYGVLRRPAGVTSILVEVGYLTNPGEEALFGRPETQELVAATLADAVDTWITDPTAAGSGFTDDPIFRGYGPSGAGGVDRCEDPPL
ncbi:MAG: N-acetylmuramoyl-L-alanine amidase [Actinomyces sp.]|nr:MAG: N-acetylmuramoyl-L-alanine amidase [Actinomyces sp.]